MHETLSKLFKGLLPESGIDVVLETMAIRQLILDGRERQQEKDREGSWEDDCLRSVPFSPSAQINGIYNTLCLATCGLNTLEPGRTRKRTLFVILGPPIRSPKLDSYGLLRIISRNSGHLDITSV